MKKYIKSILFNFMLGILAISLIGCSGSDSKDEKKPQFQTMTVKPKAVTKSFYFSGTIQPIEIANAVSYVDGIVESKNFDYGQPIKKDQLVVTINSTKLQQDFQTALTDYLKAEDKLTTSYSTFRGSQTLWKMEFISQEKFDADRSSYENDKLAVLQSKIKLQRTLKKLGMNESVTKLTLRDIDQVGLAYTQRHNIIKIYSPARGIALYPKKGAAAAGGGGKQINIGSQVKSGQVLMSVGDLSGISVTIPVSEITVNKIKPGQNAIITGSAFPGIKLKGHVSSVAAQATSSDSGQPSFNVKIQVPHITENDRKVIHVGMTAKAQITIVHPPVISVPIRAVSTTSGKATVKVINPKTQQQVSVPVETGPTSLDTVIIYSGLKSGDKIAVPD